MCPCLLVQHSVGAIYFGWGWTSNEVQRRRGETLLGTVASPGACVEGEVSMQTRILGELQRGCEGTARMNAADGRIVSIEVKVVDVAYFVRATLARGTEVETSRRQLRPQICREGECTCSLPRNANLIAPLRGMAIFLAKLVRQLALASSCVLLLWPTIPQSAELPWGFPEFACALDGCIVIYLNGTHPDCLLSRA